MTADTRRSGTVSFLEETGDPAGRVVQGPAQGPGLVPGRDRLPVPDSHRDGPGHQAPPDAEIPLRAGRDEQPRAGTGRVRGLLMPGAGREAQGVRAAGNGSYLLRFLRSSLGLKVLMALTGAVLFGFVVAHVSGNLLVFSGPEKMNAYSAMLKSNMGALWGARSILFLAVVVHLLAANELTKRSDAARPVPYAVKEPHGTTYAARTMRWTGSFLVLFIVFHLLHFTTGHLHPSFVEGDPYHNVVAGFRSVPVALAYIVLMLGLGLHLSHGVWSMLQTLGVNRPAWEPALRAASLLFGVTVCGGFTAVPVAVLLGLIR